MKLDDAIKRYTDNAEYERDHEHLQGCLEFRQLVEWLKDYKRLKEQEPCEDATLKDIFCMGCEYKKKEPILDKIRAEIKNASHGKWYVGRLDGKSEEVLLLDEVLQIIDKYADMRGDEE